MEQAVQALTSQPMWDWYERYYDAAPRSLAHHVFCKRVYGIDLCQHGFTDETQLSRLISEAGIRPDDRVLDLGCGNGRIAAHVALLTGASVHGIDYSPRAISLARAMALSEGLPLTFALGSLDAIPAPAVPYDVVMALDTLYFGDLRSSVAGIRHALRPGGRLAASYSIALRDHPDAAPTLLDADSTPLAIALVALGMSYRWWDVTTDDLAHARRRLEVLADLEARFVEEGNFFLYENRLAEARGSVAAIEAGTHRRYLYVAVTSLE